MDKNKLFGHSRGNYVVDRHSEGARNLSVILQDGLGLDTYGIYRYDNIPTYMLEVKNEDFYIQIKNKIDQPFMLIRPYYWGHDSGILKEPNLVVPEINLTVSWYKKMFDDAHTNCSNIDTKSVELLTLIKNNLPGSSPIQKIYLK